MLAKPKATEPVLTPDAGNISGLPTDLKAAVPATPEAVAQLQLLASSHVADLDAISDVIGKDAGLTIQLLQFSATRMGKRVGSMASIGELVVHLGLEQLRNMAAEAVLLTSPYQCRTTNRG